jgi:predicted RNA binding protein YcfA (HicA-like mRNA interferase family)
VKRISGKKFVRLVQKRGWVLKRINGSHHILPKKASGNASLFRFTEISRSKSDC